MINLVQNAITYTTEGAVKVKVSYIMREAKLIFEVEDTGIGIKYNDQDKVFKILKDQDEIRLGLTISREIAQKYNGDITFFSQFGQGSSFRMTFELEEIESSGQMNDFEPST